MKWISAAFFFIFTLFLIPGDSYARDFNAGHRDFNREVNRGDQFRRDNHFDNRYNQERFENRALEDRALQNEINNQNLNNQNQAPVYVAPQQNSNGNGNGGDDGDGFNDNWNDQGF